MELVRGRKKGQATSERGRVEKEPEIRVPARLRLVIDSAEYIEYSGNQAQIGENPYDNGRSMFNVQRSAMVPCISCSEEALV